MTKIVVISDTHLPLAAAKLPDELVEQIKKADILIHAGDLAEKPLLDILKKLCPKVIAVRGNMDPDEIADELNEKEILNIGKFKIGIMHGKGSPSSLPEMLCQEFKNDGVNIIIFGHSHSPFNKNIGNIIFFNPGSPTDHVYCPYNSYGIIEINDKIEAKIIKL